MSAITPFQPGPTTDDPANFDARGDQLLSTDLPRLVTEVNALEASLRAAATIGLPYTISTTVGGDPGAGYVRFNNATQTAATALTLDILDALGVNRSALCTWAGGSTNAEKGLITITAPGNAGKLLQYAYTAFVDSAGFFTATVTCLAALPAAPSSPFAAGDNVVVSIDRTGNVGATGPAAAFAASSPIILGAASSTVTIPLTAGKSIVGIELAGAQVSSGGSAPLYIAGSNNGVSYTSDINITAGSAPQWDGFIWILNYAADRQFVQSGVYTLTTASPVANQVQNPGASMKVTGGLNYLRLSLGGSQWAAGATFKPTYL